MREVIHHLHGQYETVLPVPGSPGAAVPRIAPQHLEAVQVTRLTGARWDESEGGRAGVRKVGSS